ncbi:hypothetical protein BO82DRAFT_29534 [Aspergillus uvarum CBS 121591]|uniref:Uncharacterized protein n=1 Tax=Aspergillus uvarum CBS 121591 TaxID=1448315 RepID=A0A319CE58_9EURO|nr:hypothetical protein BO82DRAFT_29534 [Aspergillus uvarum CBS 121591]PYH83955.1 hypothetical protein BO82DRAFT_29534 [Aspergillus uvarum CBS 121591]
MIHENRIGGREPRSLWTVPAPFLKKTQPETASRLRLTGLSPSHSLHGKRSFTFEITAGSCISASISQIHCLILLSSYLFASCPFSLLLHSATTTKQLLLAPSTSLR